MNDRLFLEKEGHLRILKDLQERVVSVIVSIHQSRAVQCGLHWKPESLMKNA